MTQDSSFWQTLASVDPMLWWTGGAVLVLLMLSALFSGAETALTASSAARLHQLASEGSRGARRALKLRDDSEKLIGSILLGNNVVNILATSLTTSLFLGLFGENGVAIATVLMTVIVLIFSEMMPKTYAITRPEETAMRVSAPIRLLVLVFSPVVRAVQVIVRGALWVFGVNTDPNARVLSAEDEIRGAITLHHNEGTVVKDARDRLLGALDLDQREVAEVMRHRRHIFMIDADLPPEQIVEQCLRSPYTRIPLYQGEADNIIGVIHAKDLLRAVQKLWRAHVDRQAPLKGLDVRRIAMRPWFVPETTPLDEQLRAFLTRRTHFALVIDEYGALKGLITLEDIIEEIVGDIADEHDLEVEGVKMQPDGSWIIEGVTTIRDVNRLLDWKLPDDEATTIAGLVIHEAQSIPAQGQVFIFHGFRFEVLERKRHQITRLRVTPLGERASVAKPA